MKDDYPQVIRCEVPCKPIDTKLTSIEQCIKAKVPQRLFYWAIGGIVFFIVVVIGGTQWKIVDSVAEIGTDVKVMSVTMENTRMNFGKHIDKLQKVQDTMDGRVDELERSDYHHRSKEDRQ